MNNLFDYFLNLYKNNKEIALLSWFYAAFAVLCFFLAGICALVDQSFGVGLLILPMVALTALCANVVVWALIRLFCEKLEELAKGETNAKSKPAVKSEALPKAETKTTAKSKSTQKHADK